MSKGSFVDNRGIRDTNYQGDLIVAVGQNQGVTENSALNTMEYILKNDYATFKDRMEEARDKMERISIRLDELECIKKGK